MSTIFDYASLKSNKDGLMKQLHDFGYVVITNVPKHPELYSEFLDQAKRFIALPEEKKKECTPANFYSHGWSFGLEKFDGVVDSFKGSYYADNPENENNVWPRELPEFHTTYLKLSDLLTKVGSEILNILEIGKQYSCKSRFLYYGKISQSTDDKNKYWCGLHRDHGYFTGLCPDVYFKDGQVIDKPEGSGLYVRGKPISVPKDCLIFQVGETAELVSNGQIRATDHWVNKAYECERFTFVNFMNLVGDEIIDSTVTRYSDRYVKPMTYKEWEILSFKKYY